MRPGRETAGAAERRERRALKEAYKKAFKNGGEKLFEALYSNQNAMVRGEHGEGFLAYLTEVIGDKTDALHIVERNHTWLVLDYRRKHPEALSAAQKLTAAAKDAAAADVHALLGARGYRLEEHTLVNGKALGLRFMYRDRFVADGVTDENNTPSEELYGASVICYYGHADEKLKDSYVFTLEHARARTTPTADELAANPGLMTPEWAEYLKKKGRQKADGTYSLKGLRARFDDPFSLSFLMVRIGRDSAHGVEIISRYNHRSYAQSGEDYRISGEPNDTLDGKLNRLAEGLEAALMAYANVEVDENFVALEGGVRMAGDGKLYHAPREVNGVYIGKDFYIKQDNSVVRINPDREVILGDYVVSAANTVYDIGNDRPLKLYHAPSGEDRGFETLHNTRVTPTLITLYTGGREVEETREVEVRGEKKMVTKRRWVDDAKTEIRVDAEGLFVDSEMADVEDDVLALVDKGNLAGLTLSKVREVGDGFLSSNESLMLLSMPELTSAGGSFLLSNKLLVGLNLPKLERAGHSFLRNHGRLLRLSLPSVREVGDDFMEHSYQLAELDMPLLEKAGHYFLRKNHGLKSLSLPRLRAAGRSFMEDNSWLSKLELPALEVAGGLFLEDNAGLTALSLPALELAGKRFLAKNGIVNEVSLPALKAVGFSFLANNHALRSLSLRCGRKGGIFCWETVSWRSCRCRR